MDTKEIAEKLHELVEAMRAKAVERPDAAIVWNADSQPSILLYEHRDGQQWQEMSKAFRGELCEAFDEAFAHVASLPSPDEKRMRNFMKAVAVAIESGKANNIEVEFLNPLVATMKKLSDNILTHQKEAA